MSQPSSLGCEAQHCNCRNQSCRGCEAEHHNHRSRRNRSTIWALIYLDSPERKKVNAPESGVVSPAAAGLDQGKVGEMGQEHGLAGLANPDFIFVIAPCGEMASFSIGTTPFLLEIDSTRGSSVQEIPRAPNDA
jgi:hypothetical protein